MKKVLFVFGTRPEAIKMAPIIKRAKSKKYHFKSRVCVTAQHREMLDQILYLFGIQPDFDLDIMKVRQDLSDLTAGILVNLRDVFQDEEPDIVVVHGDTTTTLAAAQAAFYSDIPVAHVEAGLRTHDLRAPFPEEFNRQAVSRIATWHFAPTLSCKKNLIAEGLLESQIHVTGNSVIDALMDISRKMKLDKAWIGGLHKKLEALCKTKIFNERYFLITGHRRENFGEGFSEICDAISRLSTTHPTIHFVYPLHLNPLVREPVIKKLQHLENVHLIPPQDYDSFVYLLTNSVAVLTDSGGIQEEAPSLGKPVLVMRNITERPEAVSAGTVKLVGANSTNIFNGVNELLSNNELYRNMSKAHNPYGDGKSSDRILKILNDVLIERHD